MSGTTELRFLGRVAFFAPLLLGGCERAPALEILGSFFPAWLICIAVSVLITAIAHTALIRFNLKVELPILAYPSFTVFLTFALWLVFFY